ncbi:hypothetical protein KUV28_17665 [Ferrimonas balearica]|nr:hypothetical protein [Ferrimonas balearica]
MRADFSGRLDLPDGPVWPVYGQVARWLAPPTGVGVQIDEDGVPRFALALVRGPDPDRPPAPFGLLDLQLQTERDLTEALAGLRARVPGAALLPAEIARARLGLVGGADLGADGPQIGLLTDWQDSGRAHIVHQLTLDEGLVLAGALENEVSPLILRGAVAVPGVSPRLPAIVRPDAGFLSDLRRSLAADEFSWGMLATALLGLGLTTRPEVETGLSPSRAVALAEALADRIADAWCVEVEATATAVAEVPRYRIRDAVEPAEWDLSRPFSCDRWLPLAEAPMDQLTNHVRQNGTTGLISHPVLSSFPEGRQRISVYANLGFPLPGVHFLSVSLMQPPNPPDRPSAAHAAGEIDLLTGEILPLDLSLALGEAPRFQVQAMAIIGEGAGIRQVQGTAFDSADLTLALTAADFGMRVLDHRIDPGLLSLAEVEITESYEIDGSAISVSRVLTASSASVLPAEVDEGEITMILREREGEAELRLDPLPLAALSLGLELLPDYGPQSVVIRFEPPPETVVGVDVVPGHAGGEEGMQTFGFTAQRPERSFRYHSDTPFSPGFRWRFTGTSEWQVHASPRAPLVLTPQ